MNPEFKRQSLRAIRKSGRPVWQVNWVTRQGNRTTASLGTQDETDAKEIVLDLERLCNDPSRYDIKANDLSNRDFHSKALMIFYDLVEAPEFEVSELDVKHAVIAHLPPQFRPGYVPGRLVKEPGKGKYATSEPGKPHILERLSPDEWRSLYEKITITVPNEKLDEERKARIAAERSASQLEAEKADWQDERAELHKELNEHCRVTLNDAISEFETYYLAKRDANTASQVLKVNRAVAALLPAKTLVGKVSGVPINTYLTGRKDVGQTTKRKIRAYISTFWGWAVKQYELNGNPMTHVHSYGDVGGPVNIETIRAWADFQGYLHAFIPFPFWHVWVSFACLAGPRWGEQARLKIADLRGDCAEVSVYSTKTGRLRIVPIEQKLLAPTLRKYLTEVRPLWMEKNGVPGDCMILFPSLAVGHGSHGDGIWTAETFHKHLCGGLNPVRQKNGKLVKQDRVVGIREKARLVGRLKDYEQYGPAEWRHCGATAMGHSGVSKLRISQWIGNSESIVEKHYLGPVGAAVWPLQYLSHEQ